MFIETSCINIYKRYIFHRYNLLNTFFSLSRINDYFAYVDAI